MITPHLRAVGFALLLGATSGVAQTPTELRLTGLNKTYTDVATEVAPVRMDPVVVHLSSPQHSVVLKENRIRLTPLGGGRFRARTELDVLGKGDLVADVEMGGGTRRLTDEVLLPPQTVAVEGIVKLARGDGGYLVTTEELPKDLPVAIRRRALTISTTPMTAIKAPTVLTSQWSPSRPVTR